MIDALTVLWGAFLVLVGVTHFIVPRYYDRLVPPWMPGQRIWVAASGAVEIALGAGVVFEATRAPAAWTSAALMLAYVGTHVDALVRASASQASWLDRPAGAVARVGVNLLYLVWAVIVAVAA